MAADPLHPLRFRGLIHLPGLFMPRSLAVVDAPIVRVAVVAAKQLTQRVAGEAQQRLLLLALQVGEVCRRIAFVADETLKVTNVCRGMFEEIKWFQADISQEGRFRYVRNDFIIPADKTWSTSV